MGHPECLMMVEEWATRTMYTAIQVHGPLNPKRASHGLTRNSLPLAREYFHERMRS